MKRRSLTIAVVVVFLMWNVVTFLFMAYKQPNKEVEDSKIAIDASIIELRQRIKKQSLNNDLLLKELKDIQKNMAQQNDPIVIEPSKEVIVPKVEAKPLARVVKKSPLPPIAVLVMACDRPTVSRNLDQLLNLRSNGSFPIIVSQDCGHEVTANVIRSYSNKVMFIQQPDLSEFNLPTKLQNHKGYYRISRHYKWALGQVFNRLNFSVAIVVEDDLDISPDFFEYFAASYHILAADPSLWCVSAWNDNGKFDKVDFNQPELLYRTDFFPGLGWMLTKNTWSELEAKWPAAYWDDWMRHPDQRRDRACIRPEIPRTSTFGKQGVSKGQYFEKHLKFIKHNTQFVPFLQKDLSYLVRENYDETFVKTVYGSPLVTVDELLAGDKPSEKTVRVEYNDRASFTRQTKLLGIMEDVKSGVPRSGYRGVVSFLCKGRRVYFSPPASWTSYDPTWS